MIWIVLFVAIAFAAWGYTSSKEWTDLAKEPVVQKIIGGAKYLATVHLPTALLVTFVVYWLVEKPAAKELVDSVTTAIENQSKAVEGKMAEALNVTASLGNAFDKSVAAAHADGDLFHWEDVRVVAQLGPGPKETGKARFFYTQSYTVIYEGSSTGAYLVRHRTWAPSNVPVEQRFANYTVKRRRNGSEVQLSAVNKDTTATVEKGLYTFELHDSIPVERGDTLKISLDVSLFDWLYGGWEQFGLKHNTTSLYYQVTFDTTQYSVSMTPWIEPMDTIAVVMTDQPLSSLRTLSRSLGSKQQPLTERMGVALDYRAVNNPKCAD